MEVEGVTREYKSIQKVRSGDRGWHELAKTCVCLANTQGGEIWLGIEDKTKQPPSDQMIAIPEVNHVVNRLRNLCFSVSVSSSEVFTAENGGQYFIIKIQPSTKAIATTSDGKIFIRIGDECHAARSEDIHRLAVEKDTFQWELVSRNILFDQTNLPRLASFAERIRKSGRAKSHVIQLTDLEMAEHYNLIINGSLTNLGVLWLGSPSQRSRLSYPVTVQYIVYDSIENKIRKIDWHDYEQDPHELLLDIEKQAIELTYSHEYPQGLYRKKVRHYDEAVIRELLVNAFAHKSYTISSDIFIQVYPDRLEISNPGGLPLGVTKYNILHQKHRRNPHLIRIFHDLNLMEGEGSGYDLIYEKNSRDAKPFPEIESDYSTTKVIQSSRILSEEALSLVSFIAGHYELSQKELIALGIVAREQKIRSTQLSKMLQLSEEERLRSYVGRLTEEGVLSPIGQGKAREYKINPKLIANSKLNIRPTLKTIEPHVLRVLIEEDLRINPNSSLSSIQQRLVEVPLEDIQKAVYELTKQGELIAQGGKKNRTYLLAEKK